MTDTRVPERVYWVEAHGGYSQIESLEWDPYLADWISFHRKREFPHYTQLSLWVGVEQEFLSPEEVTRFPLPTGPEGRVHYIVSPYGLSSSREAGTKDRDYRDPARALAYHARQRSSFLMAKAVEFSVARNPSETPEEFLRRAESYFRQLLS